eukprot:scaffold5798_cov105-Isochrysis_galbana.AAC.3
MLLPQSLHCGAHIRPVGSNRHCTRHERFRDDSHPNRPADFAAQLSDRSRVPPLGVDHYRGQICRQKRGLHRKGEHSHRLTCPWSTQHGAARCKPLRRHSLAARCTRRRWRLEERRGGHRRLSCEPSRPDRVPAQHIARHQHGIRTDLVGRDACRRIVGDHKHADKDCNYRDVRAPPHPPANGARVESGRERVGSRQGQARRAAAPPRRRDAARPAGRLRT